MTGMLIGWAISLTMILPIMILSIECFVGLIGPGKERESGEAPPVIVIMPAYNEAAGIARSIRAVKAQLRVGDHFLVIADNCTDDTADIARAAGASVVERSDPILRGKSHAVMFGRDHARRRGWLESADSIVLLIDADCAPDKDAMCRIAMRAGRERVAVQGAYLLMPPEGASAIVRLSTFAFLIKNFIRQLALERLAGAVLLQGSGMAFPAPIFDRLRWDDQSLVEDLDMGMRLLLEGERVLFAPNARFLSDASSQRATAGQRRRWEHGMLQAMMRFMPQLLRSAVMGRPRLAFLAMDQCVPPTVLLCVIAAVVTLFVAGLTGWSVPTRLLIGSNLMLGFSLLLIWWRYGRDMLPLRSLLLLPGYMAWKLPILLQFLTKRQKLWIRTERS